MECRNRRIITRLLAAAPLVLGVSWTALAEEGTEPDAASEEKVQEEVGKAISERRKAMLEEAHAALDETNKALAVLDQDDSKEALEALARATGKLELLVARDPELALAPVDVQFITQDIYATPESIRDAREQAEELLEDGKVQEARALLSGLASEIVIRVTNLPLATYPDAIKAVSPLIDDGKTEEAQAALRAALNTLVVTDRVISLPVLRARHMLAEAEELMNKDDASEDDEKKVEELVKGARAQLEMAELLGYGTERDHEEFRDQIASLEKKIGADEETKGAFASLRESLEGFQTSFFE